MKIVCSPKGIVDKDRPRQGIMDIADAGFLDQGVICGLSEDETDVWGDAACEYRIVEPIVEDVEKMHYGRSTANIICPCSMKRERIM